MIHSEPEASVAVGDGLVVVGSTVGDGLAVVGSTVGDGLAVVGSTVGDGLAVVGSAVGDGLVVVGCGGRVRRGRRWRRRGGGLWCCGFIGDGEVPTTAGGVAVRPLQDGPDGVRSVRRASWCRTEPPCRPQRYPLGQKVRLFRCEWAASSPEDHPGRSRPFELFRVSDEDIDLSLGRRAVESHRARPIRVDAHCEP